MLGSKRRKRVEGWAINVSEAEEERPGLIRRMADNNRAWFVCLGGVVLLTGFLVRIADRRMSPNVREAIPIRAPLTFRDHARYVQFEQEFHADKRFADSVLEDRFLSPGRFQIVVDGGASADEVEYLAKWAAERIRHVFLHRTVVQVYKPYGPAGAKKLFATAQWEAKKGGYAVTFQAGSGAER
jgi:hypothetical protein